MLKKIEYKGTVVAYEYYRQHASATNTLVLIHGFASRGSVFKAQVQALKDSYHIIVPDLPGSGASQTNGSFESIADYARLIDFILDAEGLQRVTVFGHSMGGYIALALAELHPELINGLGLIHSTAFADNEEKKSNRLKAIDLMERHGGYSFLKTMIPALFGEGFKKEFPDKIKDIIEENRDFETTTLQHYYQIMHDRLDKTDLLKRLDIPFLFVSGTEDKAAPAGDLTVQAALPAVAMMEVLQGAGHMGLLERPKRMTHIMEAFIALLKP